MATQRSTTPELTQQDVHRFWSHVDRRTPEECWPWKRYARRYGHVRIGQKMMTTHRIAFLITYGYWPPLIMHTCDNPPCCNPFHLRTGTQKDNVHDMVQKGRNRYTPFGRGAANVSAKLTAPQVTEIRHRYEHEDISQDQLAWEYGISQTGISKIVRRTNWKYHQD